MLVYDFPVSNQFLQEDCHSGDPKIVTTAAGDNSSAELTKCYNYDLSANLSSQSRHSFDHNKIENPAGCTDASWLYSVDPLTYTPEHLSIGVDSEAPSISLYTINDPDGSVDPINGYGLFQFAVTGWLQTATKVISQPAFTFNLRIDCCASPAVISGPEPIQEERYYRIGDAPLIL